MQVTIELPEPPSGWKYSGEYRQPKRGEMYLSCDDLFTFQVARTNLNFTRRHILVEGSNVE